jgi:hypothetical protein
MAIARLDCPGLPAMTPHRPTDHFAAEEADDGSQIAPALRSWNVGDIGEPGAAAMKARALAPAD